MVSIRLRKGDTVMVLSGRDKRKTGKILEVMPAIGSVLVEGINMVKKHHKAKNSKDRGGVFEKNMPIRISKIAIIHPSKKDRTSRIGYAIDSKGNKTRVYKQASGKEIK